MERDRQMGAVPFKRLSGACRRGSNRALRRLPLRRQIFDQHRHAYRLAPADSARTGFSGQAGRNEIWLSVKIRIPTKLGFKNPKFVTEIFVANDYPGGYWENLAIIGSAGRGLRMPADCRSRRKFISRTFPVARSACLSLPEP